MRQDLKHRLITWKNDVHAGETKRVLVSASPVQEGEFIIKLEKAMHESLGNKNAHVVASKKYLTTAQSENQKDPASDLYHVNRIIDSLDREFDDKYDQTINETFKDETVRFAEIS
jgi:hypothetical protein